MKMFGGSGNSLMTYSYMNVYVIYINTYILYIIYIHIYINSIHGKSI